MKTTILPIAAAAALAITAAAAPVFSQQTTTTTGTATGCGTSMVAPSSLSPSTDRRNAAS